MNLIKPNKLNLGDTIAVIAPAGCVENNEKAEVAKKFFENMGYKIVFGKHMFKQNNYLAGSDEERLEDLHNSFEDKNIKAVFCLRGGYGCIRLINKIDYDLIKKNPKIFAGYSDITALCTMFLKKAGLITYHAPMFQSDFGTEKPSIYTLSKFLKILTTHGVENLKSQKVYNEGFARGILFGGNLATLTSLCGVDFIPDEKFIFFAEELNEPVYKIDRMFYQLLNIEKFRKNVCGIVLGDFLKIDNKLWLDDLFKEISKTLNVPVLHCLKITHKKNKLTVPVGINAEIKNNILSFNY